MNSRDILRELKEYLEKRISELKRELELLEYVLTMIESGMISPTSVKLKPLAGEKVEEIRKGKSVLANLFIGKDYIRVVPLVEMPENSPLITEYFIRTLEELKEVEAESKGVTPKEGDLIDYSIVSDEKGRIREIVVKNVKTEIQLIQLKAALKYLFNQQSRRSS